MTPEGRALFQGSFADFRIVKGRKVGQFVIEVPLEGTDAALRALGGVPRPDAEVWVAVARLDPKAAQAAPKAPEEDRKGSIKGSLRVQACIVCQEPRFQTFLAETYTALGPPQSDEDAAEIVRQICQVESRRDFDRDPEAAARWRKLHTEFLLWQKE